MSGKFQSFFRFSAEKVDEVWENYQELCFKSEAVSLMQTEFEWERFIYYGQEGWETIDPDYITEKNHWDTKKISNSLGSVFLPMPPLLHPAFSDLLAEVMGISKVQLFQLAHFEASMVEKEFYPVSPYEFPENSGPAFIYSILKGIPPVSIGQITIPPEELMITRIPVLPLEKRPFLEMPGGKKMPGADNVYYQLLASQSKNFLDRQGRQISSLFLIHKQLQNNLEYLITVLENNLQHDRWAVMEHVSNSIFGKIDAPLPRNAILPSLPTSLLPPTFRPEWEPENSQVPVDSMWLDDHTCCIQFPASIALYDLQAKAKRQEYAVGNLKLCQANSHLSMIQMLGMRNNSDYAVADFVHLNYQTNEWHAGLWQGFFYKGLAHQTNEERALVDYIYRTKLNLAELGDYPAKYVISTCGQYAWIQDKHGNGGIYGFKSGLCQIYSRDMLKEYFEEVVPVFCPAEWKPYLAEGKNGEHYIKLAKDKKNNKFELGAVALKNDHWFVFDGNRLFEDSKPLLQVNCPVSCASFDPDISKLLIGNRFGITIIDIKSIYNKSEVRYFYLPLSQAG